MKAVAEKGVAIFQMSGCNHSIVFTLCEYSMYHAVWAENSKWLLQKMFIDCARMWLFLKAHFQRAVEPLLYYHRDSCVSGAVVFRLVLWRVLCGHHINVSVLD